MVNFQKEATLQLDTAAGEFDSLQDERTLLAAARRLDPDALTDIHDRYYQPLFRYIVYRVSDIATAEDMTADVFRRLLDALHGGKPPRRTLRGWLYQVASNIITDHYRRRERVEHTSLDERLPAADDSLIETVSLTLRREAVLQAARNLTEDQQRVLALRFGTGLTINEIAETLGKSPAAVKMLQARAVAALSEELA